ncbi:TIGR02466 family protein [soil metagenome]
MKFNSFFPTLIYQSPLTNRSSGRAISDGGTALRKELARESQILRKIDVAGHDWSTENYPRGFTTYGSMDQLHRSSPTFQELEKKLNRHVAAFSRKQSWDLDGGRLAMSSCWVNIMPSGATHSLHLHPLSVVSGTFYVSLPKGSSPIKFEDPRLERFMAQPPRLPKSARQLQPFVTLEPREGDVILFESWLRHEVPPLKDGIKGDRISVSFNYGWV